MKRGPLWVLLTGALVMALGAPAGASARPTLLGGTLAAPIKKAPPVPAITTGPDSLVEVSQTLWLGPGPGTFRIHLMISARRPQSDSLAVLVYGAVSARSQFQAALSGSAGGYPVYYPPRVPLEDLHRDPAGGVDVTIPVGTANGEAWPPSTTGVYPVQLFVEDAQAVRVDRPLNTFLVFASAEASRYSRLDVATVVPVTDRASLSPAGLPGPVPADQVGPLVEDASALAAHGSVPVTIKPETTALEAMAKGTAAERGAVTELAQAASRGDQVLPSTLLPVDIGALQASGLAAQLQTELHQGQATLYRLVGRAPSTQSWAFLAPPTQADINAARSLGARTFVVPQPSLAGLPTNAQGLTWAQPSRFGPGGRGAEVAGADPELTSRLGTATGPRARLVGYQVLAELAMIDLERPNVRRAVVLMPPAGTLMAPSVLSVVLDGLADNPLLRPVTVSQLFSPPIGPPLATTTSGPVVARLTSSSNEGPQLAGASQLTAAFSAVQADSQVYGPSAALVTQLGNKLDVSLSSSWDTQQRSAMIGSVLKSAQTDLHSARLPPSTSITLTSRRDQLPLTLVSSAPVPMRLLLVMTSEQLGFSGHRYAAGHCWQVVPGTEDCLLTVDRTLTLDVPVVVTSSGTFPVALALETPDGSLRLATSTDFVRSTAFSDVGLVLMIGAALFLAVWWVRNARHGRRARKLVPRPDDEPSASPAGGPAEASVPAPTV